MITDFSQILNLLNNAMKNTFFISLIVLIALIFISLIIWNIGIHIKSDKLIGIGIKSSITTLALTLISLAIVVIISYVKWKKVSLNEK